MKVSDIFEQAKRCPDCGEFGETRGHMGCQYPSDTHEEDEQEWGVHHTGENTDKSVAELHKELASAKRSGNTKGMRQKEFAIRAKTGWGKV